MISFGTDHHHYHIRNYHHYIGNLTHVPQNSEFIQCIEVIELT